MILAAGAAVLVLAASACGGSGNAAAGDTTSREDAMLEFARCMRAHGVDVQTPSGGGMTIRARAGDAAKLEAAQKECQKKVPGAIPEPTEEEKQRFYDAALKFARCMRAHGVNVPDPQPGGRGGIRIAGPLGRGDKPRFRNAEKACQSLMPRMAEREEKP
jgi:hypothetical protein